jgi:hypothetical protein
VLREGERGAGLTVVREGGRWGVGQGERWRPRPCAMLLAARVGAGGHGQAPAMVKSEVEVGTATGGRSP